MKFLKVNNLQFSIDGRRVLNGINFEITEHEKLGIIGPSGSGKSILLKVISGIYGDFQENIIWSANELPTIGFLFQEGALFDSMTVLENVMFPLKNGKSREKSEKLDDIQIAEIAVQMLNKVGLGQAIYKQANELSGGMRKRVGIARALVHKPSLLLLDEPTSGLDPVTANTIMDTIDELTSERACATIIVSHDLRRLLPRTPRTIAIEDGRVVCDSLTNDLPNRAGEDVLKFIKTRFDFQHG